MNLLNQISQIVKEASHYINSERDQFTKKDIEIKSMNSLVTYVDKNAEKILVEGLGDLLPRASFYTEEQTVERNNTTEYTWIIDPLDGTTNYLHNIPFYSVSVALQQGNEFIYGVVKECVHDDFLKQKKGKVHILMIKKFLSRKLLTFVTLSSPRAFPMRILIKPKNI